VLAPAPVVAPAAHQAVLHPAVLRIAILIAVILFEVFSFIELPSSKKFMFNLVTLIKIPPYSIFLNFHCITQHSLNPDY
jgi:hypothetical protein